MHRGCLILSLANCPVLRSRINKGEEVTIYQEPSGSRYEVKYPGESTIGYLDFHGLNWIRVVEVPENTRNRREEIIRQLRAHFIYEADRKEIGLW